MHSWSKGVLRGLCLLVGLAGCNAIWGVDDLREAGAGAGSGVGPSGPGTGAASGGEDCLNGVDDDGDMAIDCADDDCATAGFRCIPDPPSGWEGPVLVGEGDVDGAPACEAPWGLEEASGGTVVDVRAGTCPTCTCADPTGVYCGMDVTFYAQSGCTGDTYDDTITATGQCSNVGLQDFTPASGRAVSPRKIVAGSCEPVSDGEGTFPDPGWATSARLCRPVVIGAGCSAGARCAPPGLDLTTCISRVGEHSCPADYPDRTLVYTDIEEGRGCSPCACGDPTDGQCGGAEISIEDTNGCSGNSTVLTSSCMSIPTDQFGNFNVSSFFQSGPGGTCAPSGGEVVGEDVGIDPVTVCCTSP